MLPGFRFLFAAIVLSISILVFGLGAAALLRAAHEEFASNPAWHAAPDATFAQQAEATRPVLAMLRVLSDPERLLQTAKGIAQLELPEHVPQAGAVRLRGDELGHVELEGNFPLGGGELL